MTYTSLYFMCWGVWAMNAFALLIVDDGSHEVNPPSRIGALALLCITFSRLFEIFLDYSQRWYRWGVYASLVELVLVLEMWYAPLTPLQHILRHVYHILFVALCVAHNALGYVTPPPPAAVVVPEKGILVAEELDLTRR